MDGAASGWRPMADLLLALCSASRDLVSYEYLCVEGNCFVIKLSTQFKYKCP
jgi:hypothetical protein